MGPLTLEQWLRALRRAFGLRCRLGGNGRVRVSGVKALPAGERAALAASAQAIAAHLAERAARKARRREEQLRRSAAAQVGAAEREAIGMVVRPGRPLRLLYRDETQAVPVARARILGRATYGWKVFGV